MWAIYNSSGNMSLVVVDSKYRVTLGREVRSKAGIDKGDKLIAIPFKGGIVLVSIKGKSFKGCLDGFGFREEKHEATRYLLGEE